MDPIALGFGLTAGFGVLQSAVGAALLHRFARRAPSPPCALPPVTVLKPLYGDEPLLEAALASFCEQDYPALQIVFGLQNAADPALCVVERLRRRYPDLAIDTVVNPKRHGRNDKVGNLINMMQVARHDVLLISDSDIHAAPDAVRQTVEALDRPGVGLATALYTGRPPGNGLTGRLGTAFINQDFLPGALIARSLSRQDCFGAVMALRRQTLERIGGFESLAEHIADDALLGERVRALGLGVALIGTIPATTVPETHLSSLFAHELRWARTTKSVEPLGFALSAMRFSLFWAALMVVAAGAVGWSLAAFAAVWLVRAALSRHGDWLLRTTAPLPIWYLPLRDLLSVTVMLASYWSNRVAWRGHQHQVIGFARAGFEGGRG